MGVPSSQSCIPCESGATLLSYSRTDAVLPYLQLTLYFCRCEVPRTVGKGLPCVEIEDIHERIRDLCARAVTAEEPEVESLLAELRAALRQHALLVRKMAMRALSRSPKKPRLLKRLISFFRRRTTAVVRRLHASVHLSGSSVSPGLARVLLPPRCVPRFVVVARPKSWGPLQCTSDETPTKAETP